MNHKVKHNLAWELVTVLKTHTFSTDENFKKSSHLFTLIFYPLDNVLLCKAMLVRYQLFITYMLCYCL